MNDKTPVQQLYDNWGTRASLLQPEVVYETERTFKIGYQYSVTVPDDKSQPAKVAHLYRRWGASENPMPNMEVQDGELRIPVEDLADLILRRIPAAELAEGLWRDETVRARFIECLVNRFSGEIPDADRRSFLTKVQQEIYAVAVDEAIRRLNQLESNARAFTDHYRWRKEELGNYGTLYEKYKNALYELREVGKLDDDAIDKRLKMVTSYDELKEYIDGNVDPVVKESVGEQWQESRNFWRDQLIKYIPAPTEEQDEIK